MGWKPYIQYHILGTICHFVDPKCHVWPKTMFVDVFLIVSNFPKSENRKIDVKQISRETTNHISFKIPLYRSSKINQTQTKSMPPGEKLISRPPGTSFSNKKQCLWCFVLIHHHHHLKNKVVFNPPHSYQLCWDDYILYTIYCILYAICGIEYTTYGIFFTIYGMLDTITPAPDY